MNITTAIVEFVAFFANLTAIVASFVALYVYFTKRKQIDAALQLLLNYSFQTTLFEIHGKLDRLSEYRAEEPFDQAEIRNILHEVSGQIRGNPRLFSGNLELVQKIEQFANSKALKETRKRSIVSEIRETLKSIQVIGMQGSAGDKHE